MKQNDVLNYIILPIFLGVLAGGLIYLVNKKTVVSNYKVVNVVDGDTVKVEVDFLPPPLGKTLLVRLEGVDTPEKGRLAQCQEEAQKSEMAKKFTEKKINSASTINVTFKKWDKYGGRVIGDILIDGKSLSAMLISSNHARPYDGGKKSSWCAI